MFGGIRFAYINIDTCMTNVHYYAIWFSLINIICAVPLKIFEFYNTFILCQILSSMICSIECWLLLTIICNIRSRIQTMNTIQHDINEYKTQDESFYPGELHMKLAFILYSVGYLQSDTYTQYACLLNGILSGITSLFWLYTRHVMCKLMTMISDPKY